tara:strand:- start:31112 stop:31417 length:306 start_codon:yes stop_codon:yes gene_type:complete
MQKFLSIPVTGKQNSLVPCNDIKLIEVGAAAAAPTSTVISYGSGKVITITHATVGAASGTNSGTQFRSFLQDKIVSALQTDWKQPALISVPVYAVSNIVLS